MFCPTCGKPNDDSAKFCSSCGHGFDQPRVIVQDSNWIPNNTHALWSYYLGFASVFFCILAGIPAIILGIMALNKAKQNPALKGENHAWVGIVFGVLSVLFFLFSFIMIIIGLSTSN